jgi:putative hydrolase of the HAD superfamily
MLRYGLFDLDNTLYPQTSGLWEAIGFRINQYMVDRLGVHPSEVTGKRRSFLEAFGTTLNALRHYYGVDADEFLTFVHDLPLADYICHDPGLDEMLGRLPLTKVIFTNADADHAKRVLARLGISRHFEEIIDIHFLDYVSKPDRKAYLKALNHLSARPEECILVEDSAVNIVPARMLGMITVLVGVEPRAGEADFHIQCINELETSLYPILSA